MRFLSFLSDFFFFFLNLATVGFFMLRDLKPVVLGYGESTQEGGQAGLATWGLSQRCFGVCSQVLPFMKMGANEGQCSVVGLYWKQQVCVWQVAHSGLGPGINHKGSGDGGSLGCYHGVSENGAAECKSLDLVYRRSPRQTGWQQQATAIGLCVQSFALAQPWVPLAMGQPFAHWVPINIGATDIILSVRTRLGLLQHVKQGYMLGNSSILLPTSTLAPWHTCCKGQQLSPNASVPWLVGLLD